MDRLYNEPAEYSLLGCILINNKMMVEVSHIEPHMFSCNELQRLWKCAGVLWEKGEPINEFTLFNGCNCERWIVDTVGQAVQSTSTSTTATQYADVIAEAYKRRSFAKSLMDAYGAVKNGDGVDTVAAEINASILNIIGDDKSTIATLKEITQEALSSLQNKPEKPPLIPTGIDEVDRITGGVARGQITVVAARPSMGKTTFAINMLSNMGRRSVRVLLASMEDTAYFIGLRVLARFGGVNSARLVKGDVDKADFSNLIDGINQVDGSTVWIDDKPGQSAASIKYTCCKMALSSGLDVLFVDHLGELTNDAESYSSTSANIRALRDIAKQYNIAVVVLCQLNRSREQSSDPRPQLSSLRDSGRIEEVARNVWFLHRESYYKDDADESELELRIAKSSHGRTGFLKLRVDFEKMTIESEGY
jgi:replicative DNA helicase